MPDANRDLQGHQGHEVHQGHHEGHEVHEGHQGHQGHEGHIPHQAHHTEPASLRAPSAAPTFAPAVFVVSLLAALVAAGAVYGLSDLLGLGVAAVIAIAGGAMAAFATGQPAASPDTKAKALLDAVSAEGAPTEPPSRFRGEPWASLYRRAAGYEEAQRSATLAVQEVEYLRRELEKKPGAADAAPAAPFEPRPAHEEHQLVGAAAHADAPDLNEAGVRAGAIDAAAAEARAREAVAEAVAPVAKELHAIEVELDPLLRSLRSGANQEAPSRNSHPAKMLDALVRTAADGIEDLAAGLMRANELAGVAERVTNRATLLALNAALEATRSGSEAFASIAEETRRLAEYAREATDTISRLSSEIEMKVGETIGAIQSTSEDAKAAVESLAAGGDAPARAVAPETLDALQSLLNRVRGLRERAESVSAAAPAHAAYDSPTLQAPGTAPPYAALGAPDVEPPAARDAFEHGAPYAPPGQAPAYGASEASYGAPPEDAAHDEPAHDEAMHDEAAHDEAAREELAPAEPLRDEPVADVDAASHEAEPDTHVSYGSLEFEGISPPPAERAPAPPGPTETADASGAGEPPAPEHRAGDVPVLPKIPDWLEGLEPRDRG